MCKLKTAFRRLGHDTKLRIKAITQVFNFLYLFQRHATRENT